MVGIDPCPDNISAARAHLETQDLPDLTYITTTIEEHAETNRDAYDAVVASEVIEHVDSPEIFLEKCSQVLRPSGSVFITTENRRQF